MSEFVMPAPHPTATLWLPDGAGQVVVKIIKVWLVDDLLHQCMVEQPAWSGWSRMVGGEEVRGTSPSSIQTWVPLGALRMGKECRQAITEVQMKLLEVHLA